MATTTARRRAGGKGGRTTIYERTKTPLLWIAAARVVLGVAAIPLAPFLYNDHFILLVLMRPTKEVLLAGGFLARQNEVGIPELITAALPLMVLGVWQFFALGRAYADDIRADKLPWIAGRVLPPKKVKRLQKILRKKGSRVVFIGRVAVFPSALIGAAAGSSKMKTREFLPADGAGAVLSLIEVVGAGYLFGSAYKDAGPWITAAGVVALFGMMALIGWAMKRGG